MVLISYILQSVVALGLLNVWLIRFRSRTAYRGGAAKSMPEEFAIYGLPNWFCYFVGVLKVSAALLLLVGLWVPVLVFPAAALVANLMLGALLMHAKVHDSLKKFVPAATLFVFSLVLCGRSL